MNNLTEPQSLLREIAKQTSGELTSVEVIAYVEALSQSASTLAAGEKDYTVKPSFINSTLTVIFVYLIEHLDLCLNCSYALNWFWGGGNSTAYNLDPFCHELRETFVLRLQSYKRGEKYLLLCVHKLQKNSLHIL